MQELVRGIHRLRAEEFRSASALFQLPSRAHRPEALLITCSDIGIDPYSLIPTNLADLYVLQNAGNLAAPHDIVQSDAASSVEPALALYPLKDIVVCGHLQCQVMKYFLAADDSTSAEIPSITTALRGAKQTRRIMAEHYSHLAGESHLAAAIQENVLVQLENLRTIPEVAERLRRGELHLHGWIYTTMGAIFIYDPRKEQFVALNQ